MIARLHFIYFCPLWIGIRNGNTINRIGFSHPSVQDKTQNWVHREGFLYLPFGHAPYYKDYSNIYIGPTNYYGYYNPFSLW